MRVATETDFHGNRMNADGRLYDEYRRYPFFADRAAMIRQRFPNGNATILIAGCAKGYLVDELRKLGAAAYGFDISTWAIGEANQVIPGNAQFVRIGDCTSASSMNTVRSSVLGGPSSRRFSVCVTEDLLPVLTDAEIAPTLTAIRGISSAVLHIITPGVSDDPAKHPELNWKTLQQWKDLVGSDVVVDAESGRVL